MQLARNGYDFTVWQATVTKHQITKIYEGLVSQNVPIHTQISMCLVLFFPLDVTFLQGHNSMLLVYSSSIYKSV